MSDYQNWLIPQPCITISSIKHSWLEKFIFGDVLYIFLSDKNWPDFLRRSFGQLIECDTVIRDFATEVSPASLLARLAIFIDMPAEIRDKWATKLHNIFLQKYQIDAHISDVADAVARIKEILSVLANANTYGERATDHNITSLQVAGRKLLVALTRLPTCIPPI